VSWQKPIQDTVLSHLNPVHWLQTFWYCPQYFIWLLSSNFNQKSVHYLISMHAICPVSQIPQRLLCEEFKLHIHTILIYWPVSLSLRKQGKRNGNKWDWKNKWEIIKQTKTGKFKDIGWRDLIHVKLTNLELSCCLTITDMAISFKLSMQRTLWDRRQETQFELYKILTIPVLSYEVDTWVDTKGNRNFGLQRWNS
jgi:hypothetical protein